MNGVSGTINAEGRDPAASALVLTFFVYQPWMLVAVETWSAYMVSLMPSPKKTLNITP